MTLVSFLFYFKINCKIFSLKINNFSGQFGNIFETENLKHEIKLLDKEIDQLFFETKKLLSHYFDNIVTVRDTDCPLIRFVDKEYDLKVELTFSNYQRVYNTYVFKYWMTKDNRFQPALLFLKYWAARSGLTNMNKLPVFALIMMFVYFVQNRKKSSVESLETLIGLFETNTNNWQIIGSAEITRNYHGLRFLGFLC